MQDYTMAKVGVMYRQTHRKNKYASKHGGMLSRVRLENLEGNTDAD